MNTSVVRATALVEHPCLSAEQLADCALPEGFPFLINAETQEVIEPVLNFLWDRHLRQGRCVLNTAVAHADDLRDWFQFLDHLDREMFAVDPSDIERYRDLMLRLVSPTTHELYSPKTVARRVGTVVDFYRFAYGKGWVDFDLAPAQKGRRVPTDANMLAHASTPARAPGKSLLPRQTGSADEDVRAFTPRQYLAVATALGKLPPEGPATPVRDRLWAEMCLHTGMRPDEPTGVTVHQVLALQPEQPDNPAGITFLQIRGKGGKLRKVEVPNHLLHDLHWYIDNERAAVLKDARRRGKVQGRQEPAALFLNGIAARHNAGKPATYESFRSAFQQAVTRAAEVEPSAGLMRSVTKTDPDTQQHYQAFEAGFSPHCLRHTYAVWTYLGERQQGNAEPWKLLQARLGHKHLSTTIDTYLRIANEFEALVSDRVVSHISSMLVRGSQ